MGIAALLDQVNARPQPISNQHQRVRFLQILSWDLDFDSNLTLESLTKDHHLKLQELLSLLLIS